jgi:NADH-quinone oxidoreductase subunit L
VHARSDTKLVLEAEPHSGHSIHEIPWVMLAPLVILAVLSFAGGWIGWPEGLGGSNWFSHFLEPAVSATHMPYEQIAETIATGAANTPNASAAGSKQVELLLALCSVLVALAGWFVAHLMYFAKPGLPAKIASQLRSLYAVLRNKYWVDELYGVVIVTPVLFIARWLLGVLVERGIIDGGTLTAGYTAHGLGALVARIQSGNIRSYAGWLALFGAIVLAVSYFGWTAHFFAR